MREYWRRLLAIRRFINTPPGDYYSLDPFDYYKCIFVHIPKAAGISVNKALFGNYGGGHRTLKEYQGLFRPSTFDSYFKFTIVRNPYDRIQSAYFFLKEGGMNARDKEWSEHYLSNCPSFEYFVMNILEDVCKSGQIHFKKQVDFLRNRNGDLQIDFIAKFENINEDFEIIANKIKSKGELTQRNKTISKDKFEYTPQLKEVIYRLYQEDFELLNYIR